MKVRTIALGFMFLLGAGGFALALGPGSPGQPGGVGGSPHNLNNSGYAVPNGEICLPCHTPHHAKIPNWQGALWNHTETTQTFTTYTTKTATLPQPTGSSRMCLSCHDGVTAVDSFGSTNGTTAMDPGTEPNISPVLGTDLSNDHPIGVAYPTSGAYVIPFVTQDEPATGSKGIQLVDGKVECRSCHHSHNNILGNFLRTSNVGSAACKKCHTK